MVNGGRASILKKAFDDFVVRQRRRALRDLFKQRRHAIERLFDGALVHARDLCGEARGTAIRVGASGESPSGCSPCAVASIGPLQEVRRLLKALIVLRSYKGSNQDDLVISSNFDVAILCIEATFAQRRELGQAQSSWDPVTPAHRGFVRVNSTARRCYAAITGRTLHSGILSDLPPTAAPGVPARTVPRASNGVRQRGRC